LAIGTSYGWTYVFAALSYFFTGFVCDGAPWRDTHASPILFDRALLYEAGEDRGDSASRSADVCRLSQASAEGYRPMVEAFQQGLQQSGYVEGRDVVEIRLPAASAAALARPAARRAAARVRAVARSPRLASRSRRRQHR
jgi:hypothetical protein